jgi:AraC-like DNA-binding protein
MGRDIKKFFTYQDPIVPMNTPGALIEVAIQQGANQEQILFGTEISVDMLESPDARISLRQFHRLINNCLEITGNPALGIDFGHNTKVSHLGMLGLAAISSPDVRTALDVYLRYYRAQQPMWELSLNVRGDTALLAIRETIPLKAHLVFATETLLSGFASAARHLLAGDLPVIRVNLAYRQPPHAYRYKEITQAPIFFQQPVTEVAFESWYLKQKLLSPDPVTLRTAERRCASDLIASPFSEGLVAKILNILGATPGRYHNLKELARLLQTSERTLRRNLKSMDTSYFALLDEARRKHAVEYLLGTAMSVNDVAYFLGFADGSSFRRAFKRWTGEIPTRYKNRHSNSPGSER